MPLPQPRDLTSLVLRTDFVDDAAWEALCAAFDAEHATFVSDPRFADVTIPALMAEDNAADEDLQLTHLFLADAGSLAGHWYRLLALDLSDVPGLTFRVLPERFREVSENLCLGNRVVEDYCAAVDETGTFRGFGIGGRWPVSPPSPRPGRTCGADRRTGPGGCGRPGRR